MSDAMAARFVVHALTEFDPLDASLVAEFEASGARLLSAPDWTSARKLARGFPADAALVRLAAPAPRGIPARLRRLHGRAALPVIGLVGPDAAAEEEVRLLSQGYNDVVRLPVPGTLLLAKVEACVRDAERWALPKAWPRHVLRCADGAVALDARARRCLLRDEAGTYRDVLLTRKQFDTLAALLRRPNRTVGWAEFYRRGWRPSRLRARSRTLVQHVLGLRRKLPSIAERIESVPGFGYRFTDRSPSLK
ncbi:MAG: response regulator transcription factor [Elusimicrobia bacterium]|nr:response regulator transcription factor [Elusimicrobiota bacterium]